MFHSVPLFGINVANHYITWTSFILPYDLKLREQDLSPPSHQSAQHCAK